MTKGGKKSLTDYDVAVAILGYLVRLKEEATPKTSASDSAHNISREPPEFVESTQRPQRIMEMLQNLEDKEFVKSMKHGKYLYWEITDEGRTWYKNIAKEFMSIFK